VKGLFSFGKPGRHRFSMQYGYNARRSWWHEVKAHAHLVIAAVGTVALLAVAAVALWLAMPAGERQAFAEAKVDPQPAIAAPATEVPTTEAAAAQPATQPEQPLETASVAEQPEAPITKTKVPELDPQAAAAIAAPAVEGDQDTAPPIEAGHESPPQEMPLVAAIPTPRPAFPSETAKPDKPGEAGGQISGLTLRAVTMRSGPKSGASAIGTVPAKTAIEVISCEKWCEIVYKGKRGFVYKSFVQQD
jgi:hypothetical protein